MVFDIFSNKLNPIEMYCHSGGAVGSDTCFENKCNEYGIRICAYSYKTGNHTSKNKVEISDSDYAEGIVEIKRANKTLKRQGIEKYMNLLSRNWSQVKNSEEVFAIGTIVKSGSANCKGFVNKAKIDVVDGGTGYAVMMAINKGIGVYVFEQNLGQWFRWSYITDSFLETKDDPIISFNNFAGIGTRQINDLGIKAINELFERSFGNGNS